MKPKILTEFDLLTLKFYHERELLRWQPGVSDTLDMAIRSDTLASFEQKMPSKVEIGALACPLYGLIHLTATLPSVL